jgi:para-aminobenzoate synthetase component I
MQPELVQVTSSHTRESLVCALQGRPGVQVLRSPWRTGEGGDSWMLVAHPFLIFRSFGAECEMLAGAACEARNENPWKLIEELLRRYQCEIDLPFPAGGCFGFWGYDLKNFVEPTLPQRARNDLGLPDCWLGFYPSIVLLEEGVSLRATILATGLSADGSRSRERARAAVEFWREVLQTEPGAHPYRAFRAGKVEPNLTRDGYIGGVRRAQEYIRTGDIYQVNLSRRLTTRFTGHPADLFNRLCGVSPAPCSAFADLGDLQLVSSSPESFLELNGNQIVTRPIKGTRPRSADPARDTQLAFELQTSGKETAELVMITDLLRNDLGRVCEFGSVEVPDLARIEHFPHVHHLISTVQGRLRPGVSHCAALARCFPGGSITGAPKFRAMEIIDELEPVTRGPYTGAMGYLGFNSQSHVSIVIRTAICAGNRAHFQVGAGIVADSDPEAEYEETSAKARGFIEALQRGGRRPIERHA